MTINHRMPRSLKPCFEAELNEYRNARELARWPLAWHHLERAHVIGQAYPYEHSLVHWKMLRFGFLIKSWKEVAGQIPRLLVGGIKSFVGKIPRGNTGGANVPPLRPMPVSEDIQRMFREAGIKGF